MPTASTDQIIALTEAHRLEQARRAAIVALLVRTYFRTRVNVFDPTSVAAWIELMLPRIVSANGFSGSLAAAYGDALRTLELPNVKDGLKFEKASLVPESAIRTSLAVVGQRNLVKQLDKIKQLDKDPVVLRSLQADAIESAANASGAAAAKHVLNGGRDTINGTVKTDKTALGYIRVTKDKPCFFCAMLASRGITYGPYKGDSFDRSDARFAIGEHSGDVKVHDYCECALKPVYTRDDPLLGQSEAWREMWDGMEHRGGASDILQFRQIYEGRAA